MNVKVYRAEIPDLIGHDYHRKGLSRASFSPIPRGKVWFSGDDRLCLGAAEPYGEVEIRAGAVLRLIPAGDFESWPTEVYEWNGGRLSASNAVSDLMSRAV